MMIRPDVRFGSKADMCGAIGRVRFTPNSDRESGHRRTVMSALPPKADMCGAIAHVCYGPIADTADRTGSQADPSLSCKSERAEPLHHRHHLHAVDVDMAR